MNKNLIQLREEMKNHNIDTYVITKYDPHQSEDVLEYYNGVQFISGFTGSNGTVVITMDFAGLWTDGRYYIQGQKQLKNTGFQLIKAKSDGGISINDFILSNTRKNGKIAFDGSTLSYGFVKELKEKIQPKNIELDTSLNLLDKFWNRKIDITNKVFIHELKYSGENSNDKIKKIRDFMEDKADLYLVSSLDGINWILNLRCLEVENNTFFQSYLLIEKTSTTLFVAKEKISDVLIYLQDLNIDIKPYENIYKYLSGLSDKKIILNKSSINYNIYLNCENLKVEFLDLDYVESLKSIKNETEIKNIENVNIKDGLAMVRSIKYIKEKGNGLTELECQNVFDSERGKQDNFLSTSFNTIAAYMANAALPHYRPTHEDHSIIKNKGILLVDSGGQYLDGTTDITRTFSLGTVDNEIKHSFTHVLKSHIYLAQMRFPKGTTGIQLDAIGRSPMWSAKLNFNHGTGHGLGFCNQVHEGPQRFSSMSDLKLEIGMLTTNEPGLYIENKYGIRIENTVIVEEDDKNYFGNFLKLRTVSYCPIDINLIHIDLLNEVEKNWLNEYHTMVFNKLSPYLNTEEKIFLQNETRMI